MPEYKSISEENITTDHISVMKVNLLESLIGDKPGKLYFNSKLKVHPPLLGCFCELCQKCQDQPKNILVEGKK